MMRAAKPATPTPIFWALRGRAPHANAAAAKHHAKDLAHNKGTSASAKVFVHRGSTGEPPHSLCVEVSVESSLRVVCRQAAYDDDDAYGAGNAHADFVLVGRDLKAAGWRGDWLLGDDDVLL